MMSIHTQAACALAIKLAFHAAVRKTTRVMKTSAEYMTNPEDAGGRIG
jgi:hypothetical protein